jgi:hypothetical protein
VINQHLYFFAFIKPDKSKPISVSGCKSNLLFLSGKLFTIYFLNLFYQNKISSFYSLAGCKDNPFIYLWQIFFNVFLKNFTNCFNQSYFLNAGAKVLFLFTFYILFLIFF